MKSKSLVQLAVVLILALFIAGCGGSTDITGLTEKADAAIEEGDLKEAESILRFALNETPQDPALLARVGKIYVMQGRLRDAFQVLSAVKQLNPSDSDSLASLASIKLAAGLRDGALVDARAALELDPSHAEAPIILAELASSIESVAKTSSWLESLPPTPAIYSAIGSLYLKARNLASAEAEFDKAIALDSESPLGHAGKFQILLARGQQKEAMAAFKKAAELAPYRSALRMRYLQLQQQTEGDEAARAALDEILEKAPDYLPALSLSADLAAKTGDTELAKEQVKKALQLDPIDPTALRVSGTLLVLEEKIEEAITQLERALELYPQDVMTNYQIALAYISKRDLAKASARLSTVVSIAPNHLESNILLATTQMEADDNSGAIITLRNFLRTNPNSVQAYLMLAEAYNRNGNNEAALAIYTKLEELSPENAQFDYLSGVSQLRNRNNSEARSAFESALEANPMHLQSVEQLTALDIVEQKFDAALTRIDQTIASSPETSVLYTIRAQILQSMGNSYEATQSYEKSIELDSDSITARTLYARLLISLEKEDAAIQQLNAILESDPEHIGTLITLSSIHEKAKRFKEAAENYARILELDVDNLAALNNLAYLNSTYFEKIDKAFELAQKARELAPNSPYTGDTLGWIVFKRGDYDWALSLLADAYNKLSGNAEVAYHLGSTHYMLGNVDDASQLLAVATEGEASYLGIEEAKAKIEIIQIEPETADAGKIKTLEERIASSPRDAMAILKRADIAQLQGDSKAAKQGYEKALTIVPENTLAMVSLGNQLFSEGSFEEAQDLAQKALTAKPNYDPATLLLGNVALNTNQYTWAASLLQSIRNSHSNPSEVLLGLGKANYMLGNIELAGEILDAAIDSNGANESSSKALLFKSILEIDTKEESPDSLDSLRQHIEKTPNDPQALATFATLMIRSGSLEEARSGFEKALQLSPDNKLAKLGLAEFLSVDPANATRVYSLASAARPEPRLQSRATALLAISLFQQNKPDQAKSQIAGVNLVELPISIQERIAKFIEE